MKVVIEGGRGLSHHFNALSQITQKQSLPDNRTSCQPWEVSKSLRRWREVSKESIILEPKGVQNYYKNWRLQAGKTLLLL